MFRLSHAHAVRPKWLGRSMRAWVLLVILFGSLLSSLGAVRSHALAALETARHTQVAHDAAYPSAHDDAHGHTHEGDALAAHEGGLHTHLGSDHSHDKAHALPAMQSVPVSTAPLWKPRSHAWIDRLLTQRLDRPPKTA